MIPTKQAHKKMLVGFPAGGGPTTLEEVLTCVDTEFGKEYQPGTGRMYLAQMQGFNWLQQTSPDIYELTPLGREMRETAVAGKRRLFHPRVPTQQH